MAEHSTISDWANPRFEEALALILQTEESEGPTDLERWLERFPDLREQLLAYWQDRARFARVAGCLAPGLTTPHPGAAAASPGPSVSEGLRPGSRFGPYEIESELGRGGMGVVYRARQVPLNRRVALKVIRGDRLEMVPEADRTEWLARFRREAELVASLDQHPNLVTLYEAGESGGQPYFTMQLVEGGNLVERLRKEGRLAPRTAAALVAVLARAVHHAHQGGVLHRDLKPHNVLLDQQGQPLVTDFGLARRLEPDGSQGGTGMVGTASYMAPEQARLGSRSLTVRADVYGLGAILYECLTGQPPFRGRSDFETLRLVVEAPAASPRKLAPAVDRDLETICLKCLEKEPRQRYDSAAALADDLDNWLQRRPINARPVGLAGRLLRWCRRNPVPAAAAGVVLAIFVTAFLLVAMSRDRAVRLAAEKSELAERNGELAEHNGELARQKGILAGEKAAEADRAGKAARKALREAALLSCRQGQSACEQGELPRGLHLFAHGLDLAGQARAPALERLCRANLAVWRQHLHTLEQVHAHAAGVSAVAISPDGKTAATASWNHQVHLWDFPAGQRRGKPLNSETWVTALAFSPDGRRLAAARGDGAVVWDVASRKVVLEHRKQGGSDGVIALAFRPDGKQLLLGGIDGRPVLWDLPADRKETLPSVGWIESVAYSPDGRLFATGGYSGAVFVWDARRQAPIGRGLHPGGAQALAFSPDGARLASGGADGTVLRWDTRTGRSRGNPLAHSGPVRAVAFSPDGTLLLAGGLDRAVRLWEVDSGRLLGQPLWHEHEVFALAFHPDGRTILTGQGREKGDARQWRLSVGRPAGRAMAHTASILHVAISPDGKRIATAGRDKMVRLWDALTIEPVGAELQHGIEVNVVAFTPDGKLLLTGSDGTAANFWHADTGKPLLLRGFGPLPFHAGLAHNSRLIASPFGRGENRGPGQAVYGPARGKMGGRTGLHGAGIHALAFSRDGKWLASASADGIGRVWQLNRHFGMPNFSLEPPANSKQRFPWQENKPALYAVAWQPGGKLVATAGDEGIVRLWDATTGKPAGQPLPHGACVMALAFSGDGRRLVSAGIDGTARLWDLATRKALFAPYRHGGPLVAAAFSPSGSTFLTAGWDGAARLWRADSDRLAVPPMSHAGRILAAVLSQDGQLVLTGSEDRTARLWDAATGLPIGPALRHDDQVRTVALRPDGRLAVSAGDDRLARAWAIAAPVAGTPAQVRLWLEALTGTRREADGSTGPLALAAWQKAVVAHRQERLPADPAEDDAGWHRQRAAAAEAGRQWATAGWHLDRLVASRPDDVELRLRRARARGERGQLDAARADLDHAIRLAPKAWEPLHRRGQLAIRQRRWAEAVDDLSKALAALPRSEVPGAGNDAGKRPEVLRDRAYAQAAREEYREAGADLSLAMKMQGPWLRPDLAQAELLVLYVEHALVCLRLEDSKGHAAVCRAMLTAFADSTYSGRSTVVTSEYGRRDLYTFGTALDAQTKAYLAWGCALGPLDRALAARVVALAEQAAREEPEDYSLARVLAAALLRAGRYEQARKQIEAARKLRSQPSPSLWLLEALVRHHLSQPDDAKRALAQAKGWIDRARAVRPGAAEQGAVAWLDVPWTERVALEVLLREARGLIEKP